MDISSVIRATCGVALIVGGAYAGYKSYKWVTGIVRRVETVKKIEEQKMWVLRNAATQSDAVIREIMAAVDVIDAMVKRIDNDHFSVSDEELTKALTTISELFQKYGIPTAIVVPDLNPSAT